MGDSSLHLGVYLGGVSVGLLTAIVGGVKYWTPRAQLENARRFNNVKELEDEVKQKFHDLKEVPPFYAFVEGKTFIENPLSAPHTRRPVVAYDTRDGKKKEHKHAVFFVKGENEKTKVEVRPEGATFFLDPILNRIIVKESILEVDNPVYVSGEVSYDAHTKKIIIQKPRSGMTFLISAIAIDDVVSKYKFKQFLCLFSGSAVALTSLVLLILKLAKKSR
eukprot:TRINITY_DN112_c0_g1_i1.p1 TRINITY_DN112_c0_g1~~TRINITY_DN112_c0_g1_i1.p1  ORF type:complete len:220 (-),score=50.34 TRINITY_DN112_c0_g1_i1:181-840(-)